MKFEIRDQFYLDGSPFQIISGAIHYFRVVPACWRDRLEKLLAMGCNTVETYIPWNLHEPKKGAFCFEGMADVEGFIRLAQEVGLYVIVRPSPYICAEWELGGLPAWLLAEEGMRLRVSYPPFLAHVADYYRELLPRLAPLQIHRGGPVILMQLENEYGSYGTDRGYLAWLRDQLRAGGVSVPLITSDGASEECLAGGTVEGVWPTCNFGSQARERFQILEQFNGGGPLLCTELWIGWFDAWGGDGHITTAPEETAAELDRVLARGSVNFYMFQGGTNFGFMNGSNYSDRLTPDVTSYDYDGVLTEDGRLTEKYWRCRAVISRYREIPEVRLPPPARRVDYGFLPVRERVDLFAALEDLSEPVESVWPRSMERLGQSYGYILYRAALDTQERMTRIRLLGANDRAQIFVEQKPAATLYDRELLEERPMDLAFPRGAELDILVENMGRVNFGPLLENQRKGIDGAVLVNGRARHGWRHYPLPLDNLDRLDFSRGWRAGLPAFYRFSFFAEEIGDTFLDFSGWGKGCAFLNGFHLGRFWEIGPQRRLYIPGPLLRQGENELILFETEGRTGPGLVLRDEPELG